MPDATLLLLADRVWDGVVRAPLGAGFVAVADGKIAAVGRQADLGSRFDGYERVDLTGCTLLPGLINAHVHLTFSASLTPIDDYLREAAEGDDVLHRRSVANLEAAARAGVTTVRDLGTRNAVAFAVRDAAAQGAIVAPRVLTSGEPLTSAGGHCHWFSHQCTAEPELRAAVRHQAEAGADVVKVFATGGNLTHGTDPFAPQFSTAELAACVEEARAHGLPVAAHAHAPEGIRRAVAAGATTIEHCLFETPDGVEYDPAVAEAMAAADIAFCPTIGAGILRLMADPSKAPPVAQRLIAKAPQISSALRALLAAGVPLLAGSDAGIPNRPFADYPADVAALTSDALLGVTPLVALTAATSAAARLLGLADTGVLAPGRRADLLAVEGDPLTSIDDLNRTQCVVVGGRVLAVDDLLGRPEA